METSPEIQRPPEASDETPIEEAPQEIAPVELTYDSWPSAEVWRELLRATQAWIQYGTVGFAVICIVVGAVEALFGR